MPQPTRHEINYDRIESLLGRPLSTLGQGDHFRLVAPGFMDLVVEVIEHDPAAKRLVLSLAHYFEQNGDLCADPDMTVGVYPPGSLFNRATAPSTLLDHGRVEALTYQQAIPPVYREVFPRPGRFRPTEYEELNHFLTFWLRNLTEQGHRLVEGEGTSEVDS